MSPQPLVGSKPFETATSILGSKLCLRVPNPRQRSKPFLRPKSLSEPKPTCESQAPHGTQTYLESNPCVGHQTFAWLKPPVGPKCVSGSRLWLWVPNTSWAPKPLKHPNLFGVHTCFRFPSPLWHLNAFWRPSCAHGSQIPNFCRDPNPLKGPNPFQVPSLLGGPQPSVVPESILGSNLCHVFNSL